MQTRFPPTCLPGVSGIRRLTSPNDGPFRGVVVSFSADLANGALQGALGGAKLALRFVDCPDDVVALGADERLGETSYPFAVAADVVGNGREFRRRAFERGSHAPTLSAGETTETIPRAGHLRGYPSSA